MRAVSWGSGGVFNNATFNNPTFTGNRIGVSYPLSVGGIPLIGLSSGSVSSTGVISGITALPLAYPSAFCYFPANILATTIAAGWYYCTFSTTTAGIAFLNTYTSGTPTSPASPTAVTDGKGAFTGVITEIFGHTITVPANAMGANGAIRVVVSAAANNNADGKTLSLRFSGNAGPQLIIQSVASQPQAGGTFLISNTGATNAQLSSAPSFCGTVPTTASALGTADTTAATTVVLSTQRATATDNLIILLPTIEVVRAV